MSLIKVTSKQRNGKAYAKDILIDLEKVAEPIIENVSNDCIISLVETPDVFNGTNKGNNKVQYIVDETLTDIVALSNTEMFIGTIVKRDGRNAVNSSSIFILKKVNGLIAEDALGSRFLYQEEGSLVPVEYIVSETPTQIETATALPIDVTIIGNSLFVSAQGKTVADGAVRESLTNHFSLLSEAVTAAQSGDTIYVYGGTYTNTGNLYKNGVTIHCSGKPTIAAGTTMFSDGGVAGTFRFIGDAIIQNGSSAVCLFTGVGNIVDLEFEKVTTTASTPFIFKDVVGKLTVQDTVTITNIGNAFTFRGDVTDFTLNIGKLLNHIGSNQTSNFGTIYIDQSNSGAAANFVGNVIVNCPKITRNGGKAGLIRLGNNDATYTLTGSLIINSEYIYYTTSVVDQEKAAVVSLANASVSGFELVINGNLYVDNSKGVIIGIKDGITFTHKNGKIVSTSTNVDHALVTNFHPSGYGINIKFNLLGEYINNGQVRDVIRVDGGTGNIVNLDGVKVYNNYDTLAVTQTGIRIISTVDLRLNNTKIYAPSAVGTPVSIQTDAPTNIKIFQGQASSNIAASVDITNSITGTSLIVDTDII